MGIRTGKMLAALLVVAMLAASCGDSGSGDGADEPSATTSDNSGSETTTPGTDAPETTDAPPATEAPELPTDGFDANAIVKLENGEEFEFGAICVLEAQENFDWVVVSYDDPGLDVSQWSEGAPISGVTATIWAGENYDTLWEAASTYTDFGGGLEMSVDGNIVSGTGVFFSEGDVFEGEPVNGEIVITC